MFEAVGTRFERFDCGICIDGVNDNLEPVPVRFIDDRSENRLLRRAEPFRPGASRRAI